MSRQLLAFARVAGILAGLTSGACGRDARVCGLMRLEPGAQQHTVMSNYPSWGFFDTCTVASPNDIEVSGKGYAVRMHLMANSDPGVFIGVRATDGEQYDISGNRWGKLSLPSSFSGWATHAKRLSDLSDAYVFGPDLAGIGIKGVLSFRVTNRKTGEVTPHAYPFNVIQCTCVTNDF